MKIFRILKTNISDSFKGVFRNFSLSLASISCITITLLIVGLSMLLSVNVNNLTEEIEKDMTIVVFLDRQLDQENITIVSEQINKLDNILESKFNSKNQVKEEMQGESEVFNSILAQYTDETNPLQDTFLVKVDDINKIGETADKIKKIEHVDLVKYGEGSVEELIRIFNMVKKIAYGMVIALVVVTAFLISNTIKITIQSRAREIEIRRLVGASNQFIRRPFFFEGIILGILGSIIPIVGCCYGYNYLYEKLGGKLFTAIIPLVKPNLVMVPMIEIILIISVVVGAFGSYRAVRKYLKI
jgi:cell division transport system permease protein